MLRFDGDEQKELFSAASSLRDREVGSSVYFRGLIEFSNICCNDCFYCGIRKSNSGIKRYRMTAGEILKCAEFCKDSGYGSLVLQSGQDNSREFVDFVCDVVRSIKRKFPGLGITLCCGEQKKNVYRRFFKAGAHRYLLRIETSSPEHYGSLHPAYMSFAERTKCLKSLQETGFQTGTGVMVHSPYQKLDNLAEDLIFISEMDVDMVGMGPFIPHERTPLKGRRSYSKREALMRSLNMISVLRIMMPDINIAATTAFQTLHKRGREMALEAGANIIMPGVTPVKYRNDYTLYDGKPCLTEKASECRECIVRRIESVGMKAAFNEWGDSLRFVRKEGERNNVCAG